MTQVDIFKKRFIAGAVCPDCQAVDRIVVETGMQNVADSDLNDPHQEVSRRRCVACGFADEFSTDTLVNSQGVPRGKPERPKSNLGQPATPAQAVKILDPVVRPKS
ncbi:MAG: YheV family putative metal-binding protein [Pseudomonadales bacterium]|jgi:Zn ribbon nucleic-acid-binding protein|nr:YheV family putative metal-binding protein [Pseudomonadales bacterium]